MTDPSDPVVEPANLRFLRRLVTTLTVVMIGGLLVIVTLFVIRFSNPPAPALPDRITLPDGATATAFTVAPGWYGVVIDEGRRILIYDRASGDLRQKIDVLPEKE